MSTRKNLKPKAVPRQAEIISLADVKRERAIKNAKAFTVHVARHEQPKVGEMFLGYDENDYPFIGFCTGVEGDDIFTHYFADGDFEWCGRVVAIDN